MPLREYGCTEGHVTELFLHTTVLEEVPRTSPCETCGGSAKLLFSVPNLDTSDNFTPFAYEGPDGRHWQIDNLHALRKVEKAYEGEGKENIRFDAWSAEPSNPDSVDGFGGEYNDGTGTSTGRVHSLPVRED